MSLLLIRYMGRSLLGLGYALCLAGMHSQSTTLKLDVEMLLAPFIPSNTARGGGILSPITLSLARSLHSFPNHRAAIGRYLMLVAAHANLISSSLFLTGSAANPIIRAKARDILGINFRWGS